MARAASAVPHQPDSTNPTPPLCLASSSFIALLPFASICPQHRGFTPSGTLPGASVRSAATPTQHDTTPISSPVRSHPVPHVNQGRASRPEVDERAARFTKLMHTTSATVQHISFLARRRQPDCKTNCFFDCRLRLPFLVWLMFDWLFSSIVGHYLYRFVSVSPRLIRVVIYLDSYDSSSRGWGLGSHFLWL